MMQPHRILLTAAIVSTTLSACASAPKPSAEPAKKSEQARLAATAQKPAPITDPSARLWSSAGERLSAATTITLTCTSAQANATDATLTKLVWSRADNKVTITSASPRNASGDNLTLNLSERTATGTVGGTPLNTKPGSPLYGMYATVWELIDHTILAARHVGTGGTARFVGEDRLGERALAALDLDTSATAALTQVKLRALVDPATAQLAAITFTPVPTKPDAPAPKPEVFEVQAHQTAHGVTIPSRVYNATRNTTLTCTLNSITP